MVDRAYSQQFLQQLYHELRFRFPEVNQNTLLETMKKNSNHRERCIEDLSLLHTNQYPSQSSHPYSSGVYGVPYLQQQQVLSNYKPAGAAGVRSHSVSGAPGVDRDVHGYGFQFGGSGEQGREQCPQSAPVTSGHNQPFVVNWLNCQPRLNKEMMTSSSSYNSLLPLQVASGSALPKPPKPPVPPPTYRTHLEQQVQGGNYGPAFASGVPPYPGGGAAAFPRNMPSPPVVHKTSVNFTPVLGPGHLRGGGYDHGGWGSPSPPSSSAHPPYGWNAGLQSASASPQSPHRQLQVTPSEYEGPQQQHAGRPMTPSSTAASSSNHQPFQSRLHISINPNCGTVSATKHTVHSPSATLKVHFPNEGAPVSVNFSSSGNNNASPRVSPSDCYHRTLFDQDDPEQEKISHKPLKPQLSPSAVYGNTLRGASPFWPYALPAPPLPGGGDANNDDEAYAQALISHQREQLNIIQRELFREMARLNDDRAEVAALESELFRARTRYHDQVFPTLADLQRLWSEIRTYSVDCECMTQVVDLLHKGQVPLGETNEDFYKSINTGQQGPVLPQSSPRQGISRNPSEDQLRLAAAGAWAGSEVPQPSNDDDDESQKWSCSACTFLNNPALERCEMCEMPRVVLADVSGSGKHNIRVHLRQNPQCSQNKALQFKVSHRLGVVKR